MEKLEEHQISVDWDALYKMYSDVQIVPSKPVFVPPALVGTDNSIEAVWKQPLVVGEEYNHDIIERSAIIHWHVMCIETCCNDIFWDGLEYNAVEIKGGALFVKNDAENYIYVEESCFEKKEQIMSDSERNRGEITFGIDLAYSNGFNKLVLDEKALAEEIKFDNLKNKAQTEIDTWSKLIGQFAANGIMDGETSAELLDDNWRIARR